MDRDTILATLRAHEASLRARGVVHAALFGSRARGDNRPDSDADILVELDPAARISVYDFVGIKYFMSELLHGPVDLVERAAIKARIAPRVAADAVYAF